MMHCSATDQVAESKGAAAALPTLHRLVAVHHQVVCNAVLSCKHALCHGDGSRQGGICKQPCLTMVSAGVLHLLDMPGTIYEPVS
jgi:hypothetical protein